MMRRSLVAVLVTALSVGTGAAFASEKPLPLRDRLIEQGDFAGFRPEPTTHSIKSANAWVARGPHVPAAQASADVARLQREGFVAVQTEFLDRGPARQDGLSWVMQLGSGAAARSELNTDLDENKTETTAGGGSFSLFSVPAIPDAKGYRVSGGGAVGENIFFADGPFLYLVGQGWSSASKNPPTRAGLVSAATTLYRRVHGHPAG
jgi:hypothetical protein